MDNSNLSSVTTEIDIDSMASACSNWDSSVVSVDINSSSFKSKFSALNNNGVGVQCVNSIANSLEQMSGLIVSISGFLKSNLNEQSSVDASLLGQASEASSLYQQFPSDQDGLVKYGNGGGSSNSYIDSSYGTNSSANNSNKNLNVNTSSTKSNKLNDNFVNELAVSIEKIAKNNNVTVAQVLNDEKYSDLVNTAIKNVASSLSISISELNDVGINSIKSNLLSILNSNSNDFSDFSKSIVYNYVNNIANMNNISVNDVASNYSDYFSSLANEIGSVASSNSSLINIYDGNGVGNLSSDSINFVRGVVDSVATQNNISSETVLMNSSHLAYVNDRLKEISSILNSL